MKFQSCDYSFNCIPNAHKNCARVARPFPLRAGDAIHPVLRKSSNGQMRPQGPLVAPDQFLMAPDSSCAMLCYAMHDIVYSSYFYRKWMWPADIHDHTVY